MLLFSSSFIKFIKVDYMFPTPQCRSGTAAISFISWIICLQALLLSSSNAVFFTVRCYAEGGYATVCDVQVPWSHRLEYFIIIISLFGNTNSTSKKILPK